MFYGVFVKSVVLSTAAPLKLMLLMPIGSLLCGVLGWILANNECYIK